ncbi:MAG: hypothetical protein IT531_14430 [Burkholderiales bacterium]|nr:hypothetical protein [Burkholderiales bacterium]
MKRVLAAGALLVALAAVAAAWFVTTHERVQTKVWVGPSRAASMNPYLAAMRFMERIGLGTQIADRPAQLDRLPPGATLILPARRVAFTRDRLQAVHAWIERGGHAIIEPEPSRERDVLLESFGIGRRDVRRHKPGQTLNARLTARHEVVVVAQTFGPTLDLAGVSADIVAMDSAGPWLVSFARGSGRVTVLSGMQRFHNRWIGSHDHAELLRQVLALSGANPRVLLVQTPRELPLWPWLREHAQPALLAAAVLLALWLAHIVPRFGPLQPAAIPERRQLLDHLRATGRFRWRHGGRSGLLAAARDVCRRHILAAQPRLAHLSAGQRDLELSRQLGAGAHAIGRAFDSEVRTTAQFVQVVGTLASIHAQLSGAARSQAPLRRKRR